MTTKAQRRAKKQTRRKIADAWKQWRRLSPWERAENQSVYVYLGKDPEPITIPVESLFARKRRRA